MDVSRGKNICKEHLVNIWFFGDSFITLNTIQRGVVLAYVWSGALNIPQAV